jgi:uncharacterized protein
MNTETSYTAFIGPRQLISDSLLNVALMIKAQGNISTPVLIFNDQTGQPIDVNTIGSELDIQQRYAEAEVVKKVGRPKLGVISREITLQQKHWDWLDLQNSSASAVIRKLIDQELNNPLSESNKMMAKQALDRFMSAMSGNITHYEEATRALYRDNQESFNDLIKDCPEDIKTYLLAKSHVAF